MKKIITFALLTMISPLSYSQDNETDSQELQDAPKSYLLNLLSECQEYGALEDIAQENINTYLLQCINEELEASFYNPIGSLPTAN